jgi:hypothetical protein
VASPGRARPNRGRRDGAKPPARARARAFVFDGQGEHERFGIFDPFARMLFAVGVLLALILVGVTVRESMPQGAVAAVLGAGAAVLVALLGFLAYRMVWRPPREREVLLQLAREQDESRALAAKRDRGAQEGRGGARK